MPARTTNKNTPRICKCKIGARAVTPVSALMVAAPPRINIAVTIRDDRHPKKRKVMCAAKPHRIWTTSSMVWIAGHLRLISMARMAKRMICTVAPAAYQKGPDTPNLYATLELWRRVAAHVHLDTTSAAVSPAGIVRPAAEKVSELLPVRSASGTWRFEKYTMPDVRQAKIVPTPSTINQPRPSGRGGVPPKKSHWPSYGTPL